MIVEHRSV
jgi:hypothetical protein